MKVTASNRVKVTTIDKMVFNMPFILAEDKNRKSPNIYHVCNGGQGKIHTHPGNGTAVVWSWNENRPITLPYSMEVIFVTIKELIIEIG